MKNTHLFLDVFVVVVDNLALIHLSGLRCNDVTHVGLGTRSGCHSNVPEIKAVFSFLTFSFIYLIFNSFRSFRSFRWFRFARFGGFGGFVSLFRVLVHANFSLALQHMVVLCYNGLNLLSLYWEKR